MNDSVSKTSINTDKRYLPRWQSLSPVKYVLNDNAKYFAGRTQNLNSSGACIETAFSLEKSTRPLIPQQKLELIIYLSDMHIVRMTGRVVWASDEDGKIKAGIRFDEVDEETQQMIFEHAFEYNKKDIVKNWFKGW